MSVRSLQRLTFVTAVALLLQLAAAGVALAQGRIAVGAASNSELATPIYLAEERGWFRDAGLQVEVVDFRGGAPAVQALVGDGIQVCICSVDHVVRLRNRNIDGVLAVALDTRHSYALVTRAGTPYADLPALRGKRIGITSPGSFTDNTLRWALRRAGMNPDRDVEILGAGTGAAMRAAIDSARVDAGMVINSDYVAMVAAGGANAYRVVQDFRTIPYPSLGLIARAGWLDRPASGGHAFTAAVVRAIEAIRADQSAAEAALRRQFPNFGPAEITELAQDLQRRLAPGGRMGEAEFRNLLDVLSISDPGLRPISLAEAQPRPPAER
jgi:NitT/TauT family transport system substrate-binding protein